MENHDLSVFAHRRKDAEIELEKFENDFDMKKAEYKAFKIAEQFELNKNNPFKAALEISGMTFEEASELYMENK